MLSRLARYVSLVAEAVLVTVVGALTGTRRDENLWVFGARGGDAFAGNAKYLFLHVAAECVGVRAVWVGRDRETLRSLRRRGYEAYHAFSPRGAALQFRAGAVFVTHNVRDVNRFAVGGATMVNLWHGIPLKRIGFDAELGTLPGPVRRVSEYLFDRYDLVTVPGEGAITPFRTAFELPADRFAATGYPRTDALFGPVGHADLGAAETERVRALADDASVVLYLPTYRDDPAARATEHLPYDALERLGTERDVHVVLKLHPAERIDVDLDGYDRIHQLPAGADPFRLLPLADVLVTDYSSIAFEFLLLDRPLVYYAYDLASYRDERGFYFDFEAVTPGERASDPDGLVAALARSLDGTDRHADARRRVRDRFFDDPGPGRAAATVQAVRRQLAVDDPRKSSRLRDVDALSVRGARLAGGRGGATVRDGSAADARTEREDGASDGDAA